MAYPKYSCSEVTLSLALFGNKDEILRRWKLNGISPDEFGLQNIEDSRFIRIVPELRRCVIASNPRYVLPGFILQVIPDSNVESGDRHSIFIESFDDEEVTYTDDNGTYTIPTEKLMQWWNRTNKLYVKCSPANGCER